LRENLVFDKARILSGVFILLLLLTLFFLKLNYILISLIIILSFYDLFFSKIITIKKFFIFIFPIFFLFIFIYFSNLDPLYLVLIFFLFLFLSILNVKYNFFLLTTFVSFFCILIYLNTIDDKIIFYLIFISFINDTIAYIIGKNFRGPLIVPYLSPNKTWSGTLSSFFVSFIVLYNFNFNFIECFFISSSFFFGDLFFSFIKRKYSIKDFSNIIPGHGGALDRIDSIFLSTVVVFLIKSI
tara:strand:+ start:116 stop:838 length:723 start_codon:yes stop_codon:yes gene_type:complete